jgi:hypothetical protein
MSVEIYVNRTMMLPYQINPVRVASSVTPIPLERMVDVFAQSTEQLCIRNNVDSWDGQGID